jgi:RNase P/RNase MRP subunit POP5
MDGVWSAITRLYGEHGASQTGLTAIHYDIERRFALIRVTNVTCDTVRAALATITKIGDKPVSVHVIAVSGTIKAVYKKVKQQRAR